MGQQQPSLLSALRQGLIYTRRSSYSRIRPEGFPRPAYFIPGRDGDGGLARFQSCWDVVGIGGFSSKMQKRFLVMKHTQKRDWELLSTSPCRDFRGASFWFSAKKSVFGPRNIFGQKIAFVGQKSDFLSKSVCLMGSKSRKSHFLRKKKAPAGTPILAQGF